MLRYSGHMGDNLEHHLQCPECGWVGSKAESVHVRNSPTWQLHYCPNCFYSDDAQAIELIEADYHE